MIEKEAKIREIFNEIETWESAPINEVLEGVGAKNKKKITKRIIMFGATQVGKTTAIISLLGVKTERQGELEGLLRGGISYGKSSTSTTVIYSRSQNDKFGIYIGNVNDVVDTSKIEYCTVDEFKNHIKELKDENKKTVNNNNFSDGMYATTYIYIPEEFFENNDDQNIQIVDSRGFGERNVELDNGNSISSNEINNYIDGLMPFASGIIAVVSADKLTYLQSDYNHILRKKAKNQVVLVVSRAVGTILNEINTANNGDPKELAEYLKEYYNEKIIREQYVDLKFDGRVFPLEKKEYFLKTNSLCNIAETVDYLKKDIMSEVEKMECRTSINMCKESLENEIQINEESIDSKKDDNIKAEEGIKRYKEKIKNSENIIEKAKKEIKDIESKEKTFDEKYKPLLDKCEAISNRIRNNTYVSNAEKILTKADDFNWFNGSEIIGEIFYSAIIEAVNDVFSGLLEDKEIITKVIGDYFIKISVRNEVSGIIHGKKWRQKVLFKAENHEKAILEKICEDIKNDISEKRKKLKSRDKSENIKKQAEESINHYNKKIIELENSNKEREEEINSLYKRISALETTKKNINKVFVSAYYKKRDELIMRINNENDAEIQSALFTVLSAIEMNMKEIIESV